MDIIRKPLWQRIARIMLLCVTAILALGGLSFILLHFVGSEAELRAWLRQIKTPLLLWRLVLYTVIAFFWLHRVRGYLLSHCTRRFQVYRLEIMTVCLFVMIEITCSRWGM
ncbi:hypothetical protein A8M40_11470 [Escherichia coli]|uniref:hypothetical protein n=1 Tax=Escherichia coli TaxID=562 RepID=UPI000B42BC5F|nr:hypothetical protein [Escherichia coli]OWD80465.1 hypothetical protein A8M40_11470 [Escherichia coli]RCO96597.1 hypothetical protein BEA19_21490 [Escherichia coli]STH89368.1 Uncharacterised protein [Escherichia coli]HAH2692891.1 hypothetical protein [Escherichia coli]HAI0304720.1 hypothetical protein [Escherichia coli]